MNNETSSKTPVEQPRLVRLYSLVGWVKSAWSGKKPVNIVLKVAIIIGLFYIVILVVTICMLLVYRR